MKRLLPETNYVASALSGITGALLRSGVVVGRVEGIICKTSSPNPTIFIKDDDGDTHSVSVCPGILPNHQQIKGERVLHAVEITCIEYLPTVGAERKAHRHVEVLHILSGPLKGTSRQYRSMVPPHQYAGVPDVLSWEELEAS